MDKQQFIAQLRKGLSGLPQNEIEEQLTFYSEMIDDRMEEGLLEQDAVSAVGSVDDIISLATEDIARDKKAKPKKRLSALTILLLILGSPLWFSLAVAVFSLTVSLYASLWAVLISLWAVFGSLIGCAFGGIALGIIFACTGNAISGIAVIGAAFVCGGLSILAFYGCKAVTKGTLTLTKKVAIWIIGRFTDKEEA